MLLFDISSVSTVEAKLISDRLCLFDNLGDEMDNPVFIRLSSLQGSNSGQQQHSQSTTTLSIADDDMIDITPREQNYSPMADDSSSYDRPSSPTHSAFARQMNDPEGEFLY